MEQMQLKDLLQKIDEERAEFPFVDNYNLRTTDLVC